MSEFLLRINRKIHEDRHRFNEYYHVLKDKFIRSELSEENYKFIKFQLWLLARKEHIVKWLKEYRLNAEFECAEVPKQRRVTTDGGGWRSTGKRSSSLKSGEWGEEREWVPSVSHTIQTYYVPKYTEEEKEELRRQWWLKEIDSL